MWSNARPGCRPCDQREEEERREEQEGGRLLEELKIEEIEKSDELWGDITGVFVEFITDDAEPYENR